MRWRADAVIAFQEAPSFYAEVASLVGRRWQLIVSERSAIPLDQSGLAFRAIRRMHVTADVVTTNSHANRRLIEDVVPALRDRVVTVYNAVDLERFAPGTQSTVERNGFVVLASHKASRNFEGLALGVRLLLDDPSVPPFSIAWYGDEAPGWLARDARNAADLGVEHVLKLLPATRTPETILASADALILPSLWEGLPNSVCEALAAGCPVLIGDIADARSLVVEGDTGFVFDSTSPSAIAEAIRCFLRLSTEQRNRMRIAARQFAEVNFNPDRYVAAYERLLIDPQVSQRRTR